MASIAKASCRLALTTNTKSAAQRSSPVAAHQPKVASSFQKKAFLSGDGKITSARRVAVNATIRRGVYAGFEDQNPTAPPAPPAMPEELKKEYEKAMADPEARKEMEAMQKTMMNPEVANQMKAMGSFMQNDKVKESLQEMQNDPEMAEFFAEIKKNPQALMKYMNDPKMLQKFAQALGPEARQAIPPVTPGGASPAPEPEINNLHDAAKFGDLEAVEDFIAIGKDVNAQDEVGRTPLHFASAYAHVEIMNELIENGANVNLVDVKNNSPLHYGAGYGRGECVGVLLDNGADVTLQNDTGKLAADLAGMDSRNPISQDEELLARMKP
eukprot:CAMPEP_0118932334 /NCGR_PEP_ID=MMETSP1169-20130426/9897_1 /TAXON_ID=36882 /ORGANISM="Pyramimonas obovata, Strain CCMP722" /LENGTH=326 /DNA_ID=CAMNT_0006874977 /DNA_START=52 /DNA_END=1032 /DNA_ORIENTATION=+